LSVRCTEKAQKPNYLVSSSSRGVCVISPNVFGGAERKICESPWMILKHLEFVRTDGTGVTSEIQRRVKEAMKKCGVAQLDLQLCSTRVSSTRLHPPEERVSKDRIAKELNNRIT
jgi:hypothetical protein